jgi:hypothetical protein
MRRLALVSLLALAALPVTAVAQDTPEQVVSTYFRHVARGEMRPAARLTHSEALNAFRDTVAAARARGERYGYSDEAFPAGTDVRRLPADSVLAALLAAFQEEEEVLVMLRAEPLGHVMRGDTAFVVTMLRVGDEDHFLEYPLVIMLRREGTQWKLDPGRAFADVLAGGALYLLAVADMRSDVDS